MSRLSALGPVEANAVAHTNAPAIDFHLSSLDQSLIRTYIRLCLCFPCRDIDRPLVSQRLTTSVQHVISQFPFLAGEVLPDTSSQQAGRVYVRLQPNDIANFKSTLKVLNETLTYEKLQETGFPGDVFVGEDFAIDGIGDSPTDGIGKVLHIQGTFIPGGLVVSVYLHHSVGDLGCLKEVLKCMSGERVENLKEQEVVRRRLESDEGAPSLRESVGMHPEYWVGERKLAPSGGCCKVLGVDLEKLGDLRDGMNESLKEQDGNRALRASMFDTLAAVLWKTIIRARHTADQAASEEANSALLFPVNIRNSLQPPLPANYTGNACLFTYTTQPKSHLTQSSSTITNLAPIALSIRQSILANTKSPQQTLSAIRVINNRPDVRSVNHPNINFADDVFLTSWADLPTEADLGLGLGAPKALRKPSRYHSGYGCMVLPRREKEGVWEVQVQLGKGIMEGVLRELGGMGLLRSVD